MIKEEKRQYRDLLARLKSEKLQESYLRLSSSRTLHGLRNLTGESIDSGSFKMSTFQDEVSLFPSMTLKLMWNTYWCPRILFKRVANPQNLGRSRNPSICSDGGNSDSQFKPTYPTINAKELFCLMSTITLAFESTYDFLDTTSEDYCLEPELGVRINHIFRIY